MPPPFRLSASAAAAASVKPAARIRAKLRRVKLLAIPFLRSAIALLAPDPLALFQRPCAGPPAGAAPRLPGQKPALARPELLALDQFAPRLRREPVFFPRPCASSATAHNIVCAALRGSDFFAGRRFSPVALIGTLAETGE